MVSKLSTTSHRSDIVGLKYVYPVISRRMGGLSIGINFNTNNACNWRCIYCQVPGLILGAAPEIDLNLLEDELRLFLKDVLDGDFYERFDVDADKRVIKDIAIAGNGEPTSLKEFPEAVALIGKLATELGVFPQGRYVLITNGSLVHQAKVQAGLKVLDYFGGEVWFKLDSATEEGRALINNTAQSCKASVNNLMLATQCCKTKLQTCLVDYDNQGLSELEQSAYLDLLAELKNGGCKLQGILLYSMARLSLQPEACKLKPLSFDVLEAFAHKIRLLGFDVSVSL